MSEVAREWILVDYVDHTDVGTTQLLTVPASHLVWEVRVRIAETFDNAPTISVGDGDDADGYLQTGDILHLTLRQRRIDLLDKAALRQGRPLAWTGDLAAERAGLGRERLERILKRRRLIAASNRMSRVTDAARGVAPLEIAEEATHKYVDPTPY